MAGILLARNNSRIIGVVVNDHEKYEGRVLEDGFVMSSLNALSREVNEKGYFLMIKTTADISEFGVCFHVEYGWTDFNGILRSRL